MSNVASHDVKMGYGGPWVRVYYMGRMIIIWNHFNTGAIYPILDRWTFARVLKKAWGY